MNQETYEKLKEAQRLYKNANKIFDKVSDITIPLMKEVAIRNDPEEMLQYIGMSPCSFDRAEIRGQYKENFPWGEEEQTKCADAQNKILKELREEKEFSFNFMNKVTMEFLCWVDRILFIKDFIDELEEYGLDEEDCEYLRVVYKHKEMNLIKFYQDNCLQDCNDVKRYVDSWLELKWKKWKEISKHI